MNLGLMQGRLSKPANGHIQEFPENWELEFASLKECELAGVEWLITKGCALDNPMYTSPVTAGSYPVMSICLDTLVDKRIIDENYLNENLVALCETLLDCTPIRNITIPLLEESSMCDGASRKTFCRLIKNIGDSSKYVEFFADKINNVHLKDRTYDAKTVSPLEGDTDFETIFKSLKRIGYSGPYILQTARSETGKEKQTITEHKKIFEDLYEKFV